MRRAMLMNTDDEESEVEEEEEEEEEESSESEPEEDLQARIDALSDDEAKEELKEAQLRKLMEESQVDSLSKVKSLRLSDSVRCQMTRSRRSPTGAAARGYGGPLRFFEVSDVEDHVRRLISSGHSPHANAGDSCCYYYI
jgi:hypothetical protein